MTIEPPQLSHTERKAGIDSSGASRKNMTS